MAFHSTLCRAIATVTGACDPPAGPVTSKATNSSPHLYATVMFFKAEAHFVMLPYGNLEPIKRFNISKTPTTFPAFYLGNLENMDTHILSLLNQVGVTDQPLQGSVIQSIANQIRGKGRMLEPRTWLELIIVYEDVYTFIFEMKMVDSAWEEGCSICLDEFVILESVPDLPCGHHFHIKCIVNWLKRSYSCPLCRTTLNVVNPHLQIEGG